MNPEKILLPIDVRCCPLEVFDFVNRHAHRPDIAVILLHVVHLNILHPENQIYEELGREAHGHLGRLVEEFVAPSASVRVHVRAGDLAEEILAEARAEGVDMILLPSYGPSLWNRLKRFWQPAAHLVVSTFAERVLRQARCDVVVLVARTRFDCERAWGRPANGAPAESGAAVRSIFQGRERGVFARLPPAPQWSRASSME